MPNRSKQRSVQHLIDENAQRLLQNLIPTGWVLRNYRPDYGIDFALEVFQEVSIESSAETYETLGEHLFIQLKGQREAKRRTLKIYNRYNVEKAVLVEDKTSIVAEIEVIKFSIEVPELVTIQRMGAGLPVILILAEISSGNCYFICLNDYIDKILIPKFRGNDYTNSKTRTLYIPTYNTLRSPDSASKILGWYAKRNKLLSAFQKMVYQQKELAYIDDILQRKSLAEHFSRILLRYDFWNDPSWKILGELYQEINNVLDGELIPDFSSMPPDFFETEAEYQEWFEEITLTRIWNSLSALSSVYEETCREWFLPTPHGFMTSYPKKCSFLTRE